MNSKKYCLIVYVPVSHAETVKKAIFDAGAGRYERYDCCAWQTLGTGQFRSLPGSDPFIVSSSPITTVEEIRVETVCTEDCLPAVIDALRSAHPYEEPAYMVVALAG